jgi:hypothetical protein
MNPVLAERFLSLFAVENNQPYYTLLIREPDRQFGVRFQYFYDLFETRNKSKLELNRNSMRAT